MATPERLKQHHNQAALSFTDQTLESQRLSYAAELSISLKAAGLPWPILLSTLSLQRAAIITVLPAHSLMRSLERPQTARHHRPPARRHTSRPTIRPLRRRRPNTKVNVVRPALTQRRYPRACTALRPPHRSPNLSLRHRRQVPRRRVDFARGRGFHRAGENTSDEIGDSLRESRIACAARLGILKTCQTSQ